MAALAAKLVARNAIADNITFRPAAGHDGLACWIAVPDTVNVDRSPLVAVHGIRRNAYQQAELFAERANALGRTVIAPLFSKHDWPRYQQAVRSGRADSALLTLLDELKAEAHWHTAQFELFGFSGGAQFAHRFAMMQPHMVSRLTVASAGWYTFPDESRFPYGLSPRPDGTDPWCAVTQDTFTRFLAIPTQVCVGADDTARDPNLRSGEQIDAQQGENRLIRGIRWTQALQDAAKARSLPPRASFIALSGCDHDFRQCVLRGGLDRVVIPSEKPPRPTIGPCGRDCAACKAPCKVGLSLLRSV